MRDAVLASYRTSMASHYSPFIRPPAIEEEEVESSGEALRAVLPLGLEESKQRSQETVKHSKVFEYRDHVPEDMNRQAEELRQKLEKYLASNPDL